MTPEASELARITAKRDERRAYIENWLSGIAEQRGEGCELTLAETEKFRAMTRDLRAIEHRAAEYESELQRVGELPPGLAKRAKAGVLNPRSAGAMCPLHFEDSELRRLQAATLRGETLRLEARAVSTPDSLLPAQLVPYPVQQIHESRILDHLAGYGMDTASITFIRHASTTGTAGTTGEAQPKPELTFVTDQLTERARKVAGHVGISWEIANDWPAWQQYVGTELGLQIRDEENRQLLSGDGVGENMVGFFKTPGILTHDCALDTGTNVTVWDSLEKSLAQLRTGPALAEGNLWIFNVEDWSEIRRVKDGFGRFLVSADPSTDQVSQAWGVEVLATTQCPVGQGLLLCTPKLGYAAIREALAIRVGYAGTDFSSNVIRYVAETRFVLCVTRPSAVLAVTNLPTPTTTKAKTAK